MHPFHAIYALGQLHNCHHIPPSLLPISPSLPSVPPILTLNPPPTCWVGVGGGGGVNNNLSIFLAVHEISRTFEILPPPQFPWEPPPPEWGGSTIFLLVSGVYDISRTFYFGSPKTPMPWDPPPGRTLIFLGSLCQCLSDETLKAVGPFYLVSMPGEVKYPTSPHWNV